MLQMAKDYQNRFIRGKKNSSLNEIRDTNDEIRLLPPGLTEVAEQFLSLGRRKSIPDFSQLFLILRR